MTMKKKQMILYIFFFRVSACIIYNIYIFIFLYVYNLVRTHMHTSMKRRIGSKKKKSTQKRTTVMPHFKFSSSENAEKSEKMKKKKAVSKREAKQTKQLIPARINYNRRRKNETLKRDGRVTLKT